MPMGTEEVPLHTIKDDEMEAIKAILKDRSIIGVIKRILQSRDQEASLYIIVEQEVEGQQAKPMNTVQIFFTNFLAKKLELGNKN
ncbi:MAG: hypothetical protein ABIS11_04840 [Candidatus Dojkabacteria bacterium]